MADRDAIVNFLDGYLKSREIKDASQNGLQVQGKPQVKKIAFGVSASLEFIKRAVAAKADMLIVHHGLLWGRSAAIKGPFRAKLDALLKNDITLAAWHLPLDKHPVSGNNARIMKLLGAGGLKPFGAYEGEAIGFRGSFARPKPMPEIVKVLCGELDADILAFSFGPKKVKTLAVISGGAQRMFEQAVEAGLDLYVTGEVSEFVQEMARESRTNFISAGHYNTEKPGVQALAKLLRSKFRVKTEFIDVPNPI